MQDLFLPVRKVPMAEMLKGHKTTSGLSHLIITDTKEGPLIVNTCSKNYVVITNKDIFSPLEKHLKDDFTIESKVQHVNHAKFYVDYIIKDDQMQVLKKDMVFPKIRVMNSYDGSLKFSFSFGFYRLICENGMTAPVPGSESRKFKMMHTPSAIGKWDKIVELTKDFLSNSKELLQGYKDMANIKLSYEEAVERLLFVVENTKAPSKKKEDMIATMKKEHDMGIPYSNWLVYNAVNYQLNHGEGKAAPHKKDKVDRQVLNLLLP